MITSVIDIFIIFI